MPYDAAPTGALRGARRPGQMKRKRSWFARFLALVALIAAVIALIVVASNTNLHSDSNKGKANGAAQTKQHKKQPKKPRTTAKTYEVQSGDTLTSIAHKTGVPIAELQALNPEVDPQILVAGEVLKLQK
jgi:LysM repeat protein